MSASILETLAHVTGTPADQLTPYETVAQRLDEDLITGLAPGTITLGACLTLALVPPDGQRQILDTLATEGTPLSSQRIQQSITAIHQTMTQTDQVRLLQWLLWMTRAMGEIPHRPDEVPALRESVKEFRDAVRILEQKLRADQARDE